MYVTRSVLNTTLYKISETQRRIHELYTSTLLDLGVRPVQVYALAVLKDQKLSMPSEMATILGVTRPTVTNLLNRMERDELITRVVDRVNRKRRWIVPTDKGIELMDVATERLRQVEQSLWDDDADGMREFRERLDTVLALADRLENGEDHDGSDSDQNPMPDDGEVQ